MFKQLKNVTAAQLAQAVGKVEELTVNFSFQALRHVNVSELQKVKYADLVKVPGKYRALLPVYKPNEARTLVTFSKGKKEKLLSGLGLVEGFTFEEFLVALELYFNTKEEKPEEAPEVAARKRVEAAL